MSCHTRLNKSFENALILLFSADCPICIFSDCHRGIGNHNDNFLKNEHLYLRALQYYERHHFTYIELGDGDELWENRDFGKIKEFHDEVFRQLHRFYCKNRLYMVYGNHDMIKKYPSFTKKKCDKFFCTTSGAYEELFPNLTIYPAIILRDETSSNQNKYHSDLQNNGKPKELYLTHGHQSSFLNSTLWSLSCFLVRYLWKPLEQIGILDPTSAAKNYKAKDAAERRLLTWARDTGHSLITGHTHRPVIGNENAPYYNSGSCVHPQGITCLEIYQGRITLVKWYMNAHESGNLFVERKELGSAVY